MLLKYGNRPHIPHARVWRSLAAAEAWLHRGRDRHHRFPVVSGLMRVAALIMASVTCLLDSSGDKEWSTWSTNTPSTGKVPRHFREVSLWVQALIVLGRGVFRSKLIGKESLS